LHLARLCARLFIHTRNGETHTEEFARCEKDLSETMVFLSRAYFHALVFPLCSKLAHLPSFGSHFMVRCCAQVGEPVDEAYKCCPSKLELRVVCYRIATDCAQWCRDRELLVAEAACVEKLFPDLESCYGIKDEICDGDDAIPFWISLDSVIDFIRNEEDLFREFTPPNEKSDAVD
jgi:hypothetical protein